MQAKKILVVVSGEDKAEIVKKAFFGPVIPGVPASILQMHNCLYPHGICLSWNIRRRSKKSDEKL